MEIKVDESKLPDLNFAHMFSMFTYVMKPLRDISSEPGIPVISLYRLLTARVETFEDPAESTRTRRTNKENGDYHWDDCFEEDN